MPFPTLDTVEKVPVDEPLPSPNSTDAPPAVIRLPAASNAVSVTVVVVPITSVVAPALTVDVPTAIAPGVTVIVGAALVTAFPSTVAPIARAVPAVVAVNVAV